ncbi:hypothetical protein Pcinc_033502 [Petrolisthes cinctipes]|uniref:Uncharacterized protein n=1 Tax=Petrolisthes cinctipes TaxID=88211 RepID=A0AAE1ESA1_PETCI|nr:hypothetical protein Pcinc_033502 [Petrolisthes cinctipes]
MRWGCGPAEDEQLDHLRRRLEETERAMERLMCQMGSVTDKLTAAKITEVLSQAQAQARILKLTLWAYNLLTELR